MARARTKYSTAESRWAGLGPYYAMFPVTFADYVVKKYTSREDAVVDPFAGRGTSIYSAAINGRFGLGVELNPVGWVYSQAKLHAADKADVLHRVRQIGKLANRRTAIPRLPRFFARCFSIPVRKFLITARKHLEWRHSPVDWTLMALLLVNLHGKREASLSNQMRQTKSLSPPYALKWWTERELFPPLVDPVSFMETRIEWRYAKGVPTTKTSVLYLGDSTQRLDDLKERASKLSLPKATLLLTSPPYCGVTNYHYDQWLRLWLLGGAPNALTIPGRHKGKFTGQTDYKKLLADVFEQAKPLLHRNAVVYVRTDYRELTLRMTIDVLKELFPKKRMYCRDRPIDKRTQTHLFRNEIEKSAEVDVVLLPAA